MDFFQLSFHVAWRFYFIFSIIFINFSHVITTTGGFLNFRFNCYYNPGHLNSQGNTCDKFPSSDCDPQFSICLSNHPVSGTYISSNDCPIYFFQSETFDNWDRVCNKPSDNRGSLSTEIRKKLGYPLQASYYLKIVVIDIDRFSRTSHIATFVKQISIYPTSNLGSLNYTKLTMDREESNYYNTKASLTVDLALQCEKHYFGKYCITYCFAEPIDQYTCSNNGAKICKEGWKGPNCDKEDVCLYQACVENATCVEFDGSAKCLCNGIIGPQCYPDYNPCDNYICLNNGTCIPPHNNKQTQPRCNCLSPYYGQNCESVINMCQLFPQCQHNATCVNKPDEFTRTCVCTANFTGDLCEIAKDNIENSTSNNAHNSTEFSKSFYDLSATKKIIILSVIVGILFVIIALFILIHISKKKRKKIINHYPRIGMVELLNRNSDTVSTPEGGNHRNYYLTPYIRASNSTIKSDIDVYEIVEDKPITSASEAIYEEVNDLSMESDYDGYMIPSSCVSPNVDDQTSHYLQLKLLDFNVIKTDDENLPPLPSRNEIKRKMSLRRTLCP